MTDFDEKIVEKIEHTIKRVEAAQEVLPDVCNEQIIINLHKALKWAKLKIDSADFKSILGKLEE